LTSGDYVQLVNLTSAELNGEHGTVIENLETGRVAVKLGAHRLFKKVCVKPINLKMTVPFSTYREVQQRRDAGESVESLKAAGYAVKAIQRDDSHELCGDCFRPRHMCSCTYKHMWTASK